MKRPRRQITDLWLCHPTSGKDALSVPTITTQCVYWVKIGLNPCSLNPALEKRRKGNFTLVRWRWQHAVWQYFTLDNPTSITATRTAARLEVWGVVQVLHILTPESVLNQKTISNQTESWDPLLKMNEHTAIPAIWLFYTTLSQNRWGGWTKLCSPLTVLQSSGNFYLYRGKLSHDA